MTATVARGSARPRRSALVVAGSLAAGLAAALLLALAPLFSAEERDLVGAVLCGFALGWAILAAASTRVTDRPQRWAAVPAVFMGSGGALLLVFGAGVDDVLSWIWPPSLLALVAWMAVQARRHLPGPARRGLLYPVFAVLVVASIGGGYEAIGSASAGSLAMPGRLIDVGDHRLHLSCTGSGTPTVVLEPAAGGTSADMGWVVPAVARDTRVCVYDRAGRGWSDPADTPPDGARVATDLHTLLHRGQVPGPYVLAGHSFGGLYVLAFAAQFPDEVAGLVLIDSTAPASAPAPGTTSPAPSGLMSRVSALVSATARFGLTRLVAGLDYDGLPPGSRDAARRSFASGRSLQSTFDEYLQAGGSADAAAALQDFGRRPLYVLTAGEGGAEGWMAEQNDLAELSTDSVHRVVDEAVHADLLVERRPAAVASRAVLDVVTSVRTGRPVREVAVLSRQP